MTDPLWEYLVSQAFTLPSMQEIETLLDACEGAEPLSEAFIDRVVADIRSRTAGDT